MKMRFRSGFFMAATLFAAATMFGASSGCHDSSEPDPSPDLGWQPEIPQDAFMALLAIEYGRVVEGTNLDSYLGSSDAKVAATATRTLGRIGASYELPAASKEKLLDFASHSAPEVRAQAANALAWVYATAADMKPARAALLAAFAAETALDAKRQQLAALGTLGTIDDVPLLIAQAKLSDSAVREAALVGLYLLLSHKDLAEPATMLPADDAFIISLCDWILASDDAATEQAAQLLFVLPYISPQFVNSTAVREKIAAAAKSGKLPIARSWLLFNTPDLSGDALWNYYDELSHDPSDAVRTNWARFAANVLTVNDVLTADAQLGARLVEMLGDPSRAVRVAAASSLASDIATFGANLAPKYAGIKTIFDAETGTIQQNLLSVLYGIDKTKAEPVVRAQLKAAAPMMQAAAIKLLPYDKNAEDQATIVTALTSTHPAIVDAAMTAIATLKVASISAALKSAIIQQITSGNRVVVGRMGEEGFEALHAWTELGPAYAAGYSVLKASNANASTMIALARALARADATAQLSIVEELCMSRIHAVALGAREAYKMLKGSDFQGALPSAPPPSSPLPSFDAIQHAMGAKVQWTLGGKTILIRPNPATPLVATMYYERVKSGFYVDSVNSSDYLPYATEVGNRAETSFYDKTDVLSRDELASPLDFGPGTLTFWGTQGNPDAVEHLVDVMVNNRFYNARKNGYSTPFGQIESGLDVLQDLGFGEAFSDISIVE